MPIRIGKDTIGLPEGVFVNASVGIAGKKEKEGPLGKYFDVAFNNDKLGMKTWEKAEIGSVSLPIISEVASSLAVTGISSIIGSP